MEVYVPAAAEANTVEVLVSCGNTISCGGNRCALKQQVAVQSATMVAEIHMAASVAMDVVAVGAAVKTHMFHSGRSCSRVAVTKSPWHTLVY